MPPLCLQHTLHLIIRSRRLGLANGSRRLESNGKIDGRPIRNASLDTTRIVRLGRELRTGNGTGLAGGNSRGLDERVIVHGPRDLRPSETGPDFEALGRGNTQHRVRQLGLQLVETGLAQSSRTVANHARHRPANTVLPIPEIRHEFLHALVAVRTGAADGEEGVHRLAVDGLDEFEEFGVGRGGGVSGSGWEEVFGADGGCEGDDFDAVG